MKECLMIATVASESLRFPEKTTSNNNWSKLFLATVLNIEVVPFDAVAEVAMYSRMSHQIGLTMKISSKVQMQNLRALETDTELYLVG